MAKKTMAERSVLKISYPRRVWAYLGIRLDMSLMQAKEHMRARVGLPSKSQMRKLANEFFNGLLMPVETKKADMKEVKPEEAGLAKASPSN
jgi:hypothetical protein